jgi:hypothetical protein
MYLSRATASLLALTLLLSAPSYAAVTVSGNGAASTSPCSTTVPQVCAAITSGGILSTGSYHNTSGVTQAVACDQSAPVDSTTTGSTVVSLIPITFGLTTYICGFYLNVSASSSGTLQLEYGVHVSGPCDTGPSNISGNFHVTTGQTLQMGAGTGGAFTPGSTREFCMVVTGTGTSIQGFVTFAKF